MLIPFLLLSACDAPKPQLDDPGDTDADTAIDSGGDTDSGGHTDTDPGETDTETAIVPCAITAVSEGPVGEPVNGRSIHVELDEPATITVECRQSEGARGRVEVIPAGATWRYADGASVDPTWAEPAFDDSAWAEGAAPFGYGELVATTIGYGPDADAKYPSAWFRLHFDVADPAALEGLSLELAYDDGARAWLNGVELGRLNLPEGDIGPDTLATTTVEHSAERLAVDAALLVPGDNVLAVELHQADPGTSDAWLDASLDGLGPVGEPDPDEHLVLDPVEGEAVDIDVFGLLADSAYVCTVAPACADPVEVTLRTEPLPDHLPAFGVSGTPTTPGYLLFGVQQPCTGESPMYFVLTDPDGRIRWYDTAEGVSASDATDVEVAWDGGGRFLWGGGSEKAAVPQVVDLAGETVYRAAYEGVDRDVYHHDVQRTAGDRIIGLVEENTRTDTRQVYGFELIEHDPLTGEVTWSWSTQDAYDLGDLPAGPGQDPWHANALADFEDAAGHGVYVNLYIASEIIRVDRSGGETDGRVSWVLGLGKDFSLVDPDGNPLGDEGWFTAAHGLGAVDRDTIVMFDNGTGESRVVIYRLDTAARIATLEWEWSDGYYAPNWGDADVLPDGDVLVDEPATWCTGGNYVAGSILRVDRESSEVTWRLDFDDINDSSYRAEWIDGCELFGNTKYCGR